MLKTYADQLDNFAGKAILFQSMKKTLMPHITVRLLFIINSCAKYINIIDNSACVEGKEMLQRGLMI